MTFISPSYLSLFNTAISGKTRESTSLYAKIIYLCSFQQATPLLFDYKSVIKGEKRSNTVAIPILTGLSHTSFKQKIYSDKPMHLFMIHAFKNAQFTPTFIVNNKNKGTWFGYKLLFLQIY